MFLLNLRSIKRLVAEAFIPNPDNKPSVKLKDGDPMNNNISNLEWATTKEVSRSHLDDVHVGKMRVRCIELNQTFPSMSYAEKYLHLRKNGIRNSIKNGVGIGGYTFELIPNQKTRIKRLFDV